MIGRIFLVAFSLCIAACASSGAGTPNPEAAASVSSVDAVATEDVSAEVSDELTDLDTPAVDATASAEPEADPNEVICRREKSTGSNISRRICRTRAEIEARAEADQAALDQMRQQRSGGAQDTNPGG